MRDLLKHLLIITSLIALRTERFILPVINALVASFVDVFFNPTVFFLPVINALVASYVDVFFNQTVFLLPVINMLVASYTDFPSNSYFFHSL